MTNTTAQLAAARIRQALEAFELAMGASQGIPAREVLIRACSPDSLRALLAERDALLKLARYGDAMLHWHRGDSPGESGDVDAITCEEEAVRCGVLEGRNVDEPCCEGCVCAPFVGWEVCYFVPNDVRAARAALTNKD